MYIVPDGEIMARRKVCMVIVTTASTIRFQGVIDDSKTLVKFALSLVNTDKLGESIALS